MWSMCMNVIDVYECDWCVYIWFIESVNRCACIWLSLNVITRTCALRVYIQFIEYVHTRVCISHSLNVKYIKIYRTNSMIHMRFNVCVYHIHSMRNTFTFIVIIWDFRRFRCMYITLTQCEMNSHSSYKFNTSDEISGVSCVCISHWLNVK